MKRTNSGVVSHGALLLRRRLSFRRGQRGSRHEQSCDARCREFESLAPIELRVFRFLSHIGYLPPRLISFSDGNGPASRRRNEMIRDHDLRHGLRVPRVDRRAVHRIAARRVAAIGPVQHAMGKTELDIDRLRKGAEDDFHIATIERRLAFRDVDPGAQDAPDTSIVSAFLRPVDLSPLGIDGDPDTPAGRVTAVAFTLSGLNEGTPRPCPTVLLRGLFCLGQGAE